MYGFSKEKIKWLKECYPVGTRIKLISMEDLYHPIEPNATGTVQIVDDVGTIHVNWDNGRRLGLIYGEDSFAVIKD